MVGKWERGEKRPSKLYRRLLCLLYHATEEQLGLRGPIRAGAAGSSPLTDVDRRDFLRHSALAGAALLTFPEWLSRANDSPASDRLAWALERPSRVDLATVSDMEAITAAHRRSYRQLSVHALLPQTETQFQAVTELLQRPQPLQLRQRLIATAGETAMLAGTLRFMDLEDFQLGRSNLELAMKAAQEAEARELGAFVLGCDEAAWIGIGTFNHAKLEAYHGVCYLQLGRPADAVPALTRALDALDPALRKHRCTALADLATGLIRLREVEEGCERAGQSLTLAAELRHGVSIDRIRKLERQLPPGYQSPAVRQLREQLAAVA